MKGRFGYKDEMEAHNEAWRHMMREEQLHPYNGDDRTPLQKRLDAMSLADAWNEKTGHDLKNMIGYDDEVGRRAEERFLTGSYLLDNPYREGGEAVFIGDYIFDEYGFLTAFEGWYHFLQPKFTPVVYGTVALDKAIALANEKGRRLFIRNGNMYRQAETVPELAFAG